MSDAPNLDSATILSGAFFVVFCSLIIHEDEIFIIFSTKVSNIHPS